METAGVATFTGLYLTSGTRASAAVTVRFAHYTYDAARSRWNASGLYVDTAPITVLPGNAVTLKVQQVGTRVTACAL